MESATSPEYPDWRDAPDELLRFRVVAPPALVLPGGLDVSGKYQRPLFLVPREQGGKGNALQVNLSTEDPGLLDFLRKLDASASSLYAERMKSPSRWVPLLKQEKSGHPHFKVSLRFASSADEVATTFEVLEGAGKLWSGSGWSFLAPFVEKYAAFFAASSDELCARVVSYDMKLPGDSVAGIALVAAKLRLVPARGGGGWRASFQASAVAALIGKNRYRPRERALLDAFLAQKACAQAELRRAVAADVELQRRIAMLRGEVAVEAALSSRAEAASSSTADDRLKAAIEDAERKAEAAAQRARDQEQLVAAQSAVAAEARDKASEAQTRALDDGARAAESLEKAREARRKLEEVPGEASEAAASLAEEVAKCKRDVAMASKAAAETLVATKEAAEERAAAAEVKARLARASAAAHEATARVLEGVAADPAAVLSAQGRAGAKRFGVAQEGSLLDDVAKRRRSEVVQRNEAFHCLRGERYEIWGRIDGCIEEDGTIVEAKTRKNWFSEPPDYDVVQLRVYMRMFSASRGLLVERKQNGSCSRETEIVDSREEWLEIDRGLDLAAAEIQEASLEAVRGWVASAEKAAVGRRL
jgi:hypothetical protein